MEPEAARMTNPGNRRIDHILAEGYLDDLTERSLEDVRRMRAEAEQEETNLSYLRRLLQGRMDILRAELARRSGDGSNSLVDSLTTILADGPPVGPHGLGRHVTVEPTESEEHRRYLESMLADVDLSDPSQHDDADLNRVLDLLQHEEIDLSAKRRLVQHVMDACTAEIGRRYKDGTADVADLLPTESS
jgi:hypothetical protein